MRNFDILELFFLICACRRYKLLNKGKFGDILKLISYRKGGGEMQIWGISWPGSFATLGGTVIFAAAAIACIGYLVHIIFQIFGPADTEETVPERIRQSVKEKMRQAFIWLKKWWPLLVLVTIIVMAIIGRKFIVHYWYYFLLADIVINVILMHFVVMPLQEIKNDLEGFEFLWLAVPAILLWVVLLAEELIGFFLGDEDDVEAWD